MWDAATKVVEALADHPTVLLMAIIVVATAFLLRLAISNPKFWDLLQGHLTVNTALTRETRDMTKTVLDNQKVVMRIQDKQEVEIQEMTTDIKWLLRHYEPLQRQVETIENQVARLQARTCANAPDCPQRIANP